MQEFLLIRLQHHQDALLKRRPCIRQDQLQLVRRKLGGVAVLRDLRSELCHIKVHKAWETSNLMVL